MSKDTLGMNSGDGQFQRPDSGASDELPGKLLASKRLELNWSVEDVAHALHLAPRQIQAIEEDNYSLLPGMAIARGFVRSYAKLIKLDPAPLLARMASETEAKTEDVALRRALPAKPFYPNRALNLGTNSRSWARGIIWLVLVLLVTALVAWKAGWLPTSWINDAEELLAPSAISDKAEASKSETDSPGSNSVVHASAVAVAGTSPEPQHPESSEKDLPGSSPQSMRSPEDQAAGGDKPSVQSVDKAEGKDILVLKVREDSWIEVRGASDKVLLSRLAKAGESETIPVNEALKLVIGNATGVDAQLRGVPVELNAAARSNVARLTVK